MRCKGSLLVDCANTNTWREALNKTGGRQDGIYKQITATDRKNKEIRNEKSRKA
jgi:hypothetical protein